MTELTLHVELPTGGDAQELAQKVQNRLAELTEVEEVEATPESTRFVAEALLGIAITVSVIKGAGELADALHQAIPKIKLILQDLGLRNAKVEVAGELVPIDQVSRSHTL